ncbi:LysE family translocator [Leucobacter weissii]|uniref:LysE family translocator n=1 Tax=Leucobacter weissii TaxID=1983706 RepID=A0A939MJD9_9MICO|nr:LysE family translocator [Leucobacter weissii]MBO1902054.1 LysE family translocator [Leucobacter weissii]
MTAVAWTTLLVTFAIAIVVPGPDTFLLLRLGVRERRAAMLAAGGIMVGNTIWTTASVLGLAALMRAFPAALGALQLLGSAVLIWMGVQSIRSGIGTLRETAATFTARVTDHPLRLGMITNLSNPKALLFFAALFSQILPPDAGWLDRLAVVLALTSVGLAWFLAFAWLTSSRGFQRWFGRATPYIDLLAGIVFILVAGVILAELALAAMHAA